MTGDIKVISGTAHPELARKVCERIGGINATSGHLRWGRYASGPSGAFPSAPGDA